MFFDIARMKKSQEKMSHRKGIFFYWCEIPSSNFQFDDRCTKLLFLNGEPSYNHGQLEPPWTGAAGVEKHHAIDVCEAWLMRVTADHRAVAFRRRVKFELVNIVNHVNADPVYSELENIGQVLCPGCAVVIATNGDHRSDGFQ